jgi:aminopeptidase-like protein
VLAGLNTIHKEEVGKNMHQLMSKLFPICRSITGDGVRSTLKIIGEHINIKTNEVATGTKVYDWTVAKEWNVKDAYIKNSSGRKIVDFKNSNLHLLNYSIPVKKRVLLEELKEHIFTIPERPDWIPYRTSYYNENWGFCMTHNQFLELRDKEFDVVIDSCLTNGYLTYGECFIEGEKKDEVLLSCHICHPSLCNDNLSGIVLSVFLAKHLSQASLRYSYRFLFIPATIGAITWLSLNETHVAKIKHGLVAACVGDSGKFTYKKSRQGDAEIDKAAANVLKHSSSDYEINDFSPYGYDERQYCSPGFNLPVGCLMRTPYGQYPEYHTSADNLDFVKPEALADSFSKYLQVLNILENNKKYINLNSKCEPNLGKRGLYEKIGGKSDVEDKKMAIFWVLNFSDGAHTLLDISDKSGLKFSLIEETANILVKHDLLKEL